MDDGLDKNSCISVKEFRKCWSDEITDFDDAKVIDVKSTAFSKHVYAVIEKKKDKLSGQVRHKRVLLSTSYLDRKSYDEVYELHSYLWPSKSLGFDFEYRCCSCSMFKFSVKTWRWTYDISLLFCKQAYHYEVLL